MLKLKVTQNRAKEIVFQYFVKIFIIPISVFFLFCLKLCITLRASIFFWCEVCVALDLD